MRRSSVCVSVCVSVRVSVGVPVGVSVGVSVGVAVGVSAGVSAGASADVSTGVPAIVLLTVSPFELLYALAATCVCVDVMMWARSSTRARSS